MTVLDASTVMVLREGPRGIEVFMVKRHSKMAFMANAYVYPGGKVDPADLADDVAKHVEGLDAEQASAVLRLPDEAPRAIGLYLAAIRETFEESGFLLARRRSENAWINMLGDQAAKFADYRENLNQNTLPLAQVARSEDLVFPLDQLGFFAHWITPNFEVRRFDTRFFVARAPAMQEPLHDAYESTDSMWVRPADVLDRKEDEGGLYLAPPTQRTLEQLADFETIDSVFDFVSGRTPPRILPHLITSGDAPVLVFPGDPEFPADDPEYADSESVDDGVTRMVFDYKG